MLLKRNVIKYINSGKKSDTGDLCSLLKQFIVNIVLG